ncbi:MAG: AI-2E family transporter [Lachnospiraceae bacterium]|nr:AI-2E family transporter [Lachnospiraceae bacterium]
MEQDKQREKEADKRLFRQVMTIAGVVIFASCCIILFYFCVKRYEGLGEGWDKFIGVWQPIIIGFILAFLMNPFMEFFERNLLPFFLKHSKSEKKARKTCRMLSSLIALLIIVGITALTFVAIIPELYSTIQFLVTNLGDQIDGVLDWANEITRGRYEKAILGAKGSAADQAIDAALDMAKEYIDISTKEGISLIASSVIGVGKFFIDILIGIIVSVYVLCSKETFKAQTKKIIYSLLKTEHANTLMEINRKASEVFYGFIIGKLIDSLIIGLICYVCMLIFKMPYPMLVSIIIGVTNIIPVFGPYIGAVPTVIIIFLTEPMQGIYFLIFVIILQQIDGNIIGPKILGDSTGLSSFWVVVAIVVGGGLFGLPGMLVGVPTMALIYYLCGRFTKHLLRKKNLPEETREYVDLDSIRVSDRTLISHDAEYHNKKRVRLLRKNKQEEQPVENKK